MPHDKILVAGFFGFCFKFVQTSDDFALFAGFALPDRQGRAPIALARYGPVLDFAKPFAEPAVADMRGFPVYRFVLFNQRGLYPRIGHFYIPGIPGIIYERRLAAPAVRV